MYQIKVNSKTIKLDKIIIVAIILILLIGNVYLYFKSVNSQRELKEIKSSMEAPQINEKILNFTSLFIKDVLKAENEINFETRLQLETVVRDINDKEILEQWKKFTESQTENEAQTEVKNLLELLISKIKK